MSGSQVRRVSINKETTREVQETIKKFKGDQKFKVVSLINEWSYFELIMQGKLIDHTFKINRTASSQRVTMQMTSQNQFTRSLSGGYKMMNDSRAESEMQTPWV